jgi:Ser/Thr protein kinase RdoA (MazF antagonist)
MSMTIETWIEGRPVNTLRGGPGREAALIDMARLLARFRDVRSTRRGPPGSWQPLSYAMSARWQVRRLLRTLVVRGWLGAAQARQARRGFLAWNGVLRRLASFSLSHRDAHPGNFVLTPAGQVVPVDLHRLSYAPFQEEILNALHHVDPAVPGLRQQFLDAYFAGNGARALHQFEATRGFFEPFYFLKRLHRWALLPHPPVHDPRLALWSCAVAGIQPPGPRALENASCYP